MGNSCLKVFGENEATALGIILRYCDLKTISTVARCSKVCNMIVHREDIWEKQTYRLTQFKKEKLDKYKYETYFSFVKRMISNGTLFDMSLFPIEKHIYSFGIWDFTISDGNMYISAGHMESQLLLKIVLGSHYGTIYMKHCNIKSCAILSDYENIYGFASGDEQFGEFIKTLNEPHVITNLDKLVKNETFIFQTIKRMFFQWDVKLLIEDENLIISTGSKYKLIFPICGMPIFNGTSLSTIENKWVEKLKELSEYDSSSSYFVYGDGGVTGTSMSL